MPFPFARVPKAASGKLLIFDTHPIQYRAPVFQALAVRHAATKVYFFNTQFDATRWWFSEVGKHPKQVWGRTLDEGYDCEVIGTAQLSLLARWRRLREILQTERPAAVVVYGYYLPEHWLLRRLCGVSGIALLFVGETFAPSSRWWRAWLKAPLLRYFFGGVSQFLAIGDRNASYYRGLGIADRRIVPTRYCVDVDFFRLDDSRAAAERKRWRAELQVDDKTLVVLSVARLFERKRPHDILALERTLPESVDVKFVIAGNGPLEEELRNASAGRRRIHWLGFQDQAAVRTCYFGADVLWVPSEFETWGLVVNEAFACGIPAIVTDTCGVAGDLVREGETGFVHAVGDLAAARRMVERLAGDRDFARRMGARARERVFADYRPEQFAEAFLLALARAAR